MHVDTNAIAPSILRSAALQRKVAGTAGSFTALCFGGNFNWTLRDLQTNEDRGKNDTLVQKLWEIMCALDCKSAYAPSPVLFNGKIVEPSSLNKQIIVGAGFNLFRNKDEPADGTFLKPGQMGIISAAGCPVIVARYKGVMIFAHAGRDSLFDRSSIEKGSLEVARGSVVDSIMARLQVPRLERDEIFAHVFFSIGAKALTHPLLDERYGAFNRNMHKFVAHHWGEQCAYLNSAGSNLHLNLPQLIKRQFERCGVPSGNVTLDLNNVEDLRTLAHTRGENRDRRNLVVIARHS